MQHPPPRLAAPPPVRQLPPAPHPRRSPNPAPPRPAATVAEPPRASELTFSKIVGGAGAAATTAVAGAFLGPAETVMGAAVGSVVSAIATTFYERSLDRTRATITARIKPAGERRAEEADTVEIPVIGGGTGRAGSPGGQRRPATVPGRTRPRRRWAALTALTVGVFLIGLLTVTGVELLTGATLRGETGTSVGRVVAPRPAAPDAADSVEPTESAESSEEPGTSGTAEDDSTDDVSGSESQSESESADEESERDAEREVGAAEELDEPDDGTANDGAGLDVDLDAGPTADPRPTQDAPTDG